MKGKGIVDLINESNWIKKKKNLYSYIEEDLFENLLNVKGILSCFLY